MIKNEISKNTLAAIGLQFANSIIPLFTFPLLARNLGVEVFGIYCYALASIQYLISITEYSFNIITTRHIASHRDDKQYISLYFFNTLTIRLILALLSLFILLILVFSFDSFSSIKYLLYILFASVIGSILSPVYFFQGIGRLYNFTFLNIFFRLLTIPLFLVFVKTPDDISKAVIVQSLSVLFTGIIAITIALRSKEIKWVKPCFVLSKQLLKEGFWFFLSNTASSIYSFLNVVIIANVLGNVAVGYFVPAEKLIRASTGFFGPVSQAIFPGMIALMKESKEKASKMLRKVLFIQLGSAVIIFIGIILFGQIAIRILFGDLYSQSYQIMLFMAPVPIFMAISNVLSFQVLIPMGYDKLFANIVISFGGLHLLLIIFLSKFYGTYGSGIAVSLTEFFIAITLILFIKIIKIDGFYNK